MKGLFVAPGIRQLTPYSPGLPIEQVMARYGITEVIKLASNENAMGPSPKAVEAMARAVRAVHRYPDDDASELRETLARLHQVTPGQIAFSGGSTELFEMIVRTFTSPMDHAVISAGSFIAYRLFLAAYGLAFDEVPLRDDALDLPGMASAVGATTRLVFFPNPNNPTGSRHTAAEVDRFLAAIPEDVLVVLDDAYVDFVDANDVPDSFEILRRRPRTIVARSFSKTHGLAGVRLGYGVATEEIAGWLNRARRPFAVSRVAFAGGLAALNDKEHLEKTLALTRSGRAFLARALADLGLKALPSHTNFVSVRVGDVARSAKVAGELLRRGVIVRDVTPFGLPGYLRISVGTEDENQAFVRALSEVLKS